MSDSGDSGGLIGRFVELEGGGSLTTRPSIDLRIVDLLTAVIGGIVFAAFETVIRLVRLPFRLVAAVFDALASFLADAIRALFGASGVIEIAFLSARADVLGSGIAALAVAAAAVGAASLVFNWVIDRVAD